MWSASGGDTDAAAHSSLRRTLEMTCRTRPHTGPLAPTRDTGTRDTIG